MGKGRRDRGAARKNREWQRKKGVETLLSPASYKSLSFWFCISGFQFGLYQVVVTSSFSFLRSVSLAVIVFAVFRITFCAPSFPPLNWRLGTGSLWRTSAQFPPFKSGHSWPYCTVHNFVFAIFQLQLSEIKKKIIVSINTEPQLSRLSKKIQYLVFSFSLEVL